LSPQERQELIEILDLDYEYCTTRAQGMIARVERILDTARDYERIMDDRARPANVRAELEEIGQLIASLLDHLRGVHESSPRRALATAKKLIGALSTLSHDAYRTLTAPRRDGTPIPLHPYLVRDCVVHFVATTLRPKLGGERKDDVVAMLFVFGGFVNAWREATLTQESRGRPRREIFHQAVALLAAVYDEYCQPRDKSDTRHSRAQRELRASPLRAEFVKVSCIAAGIALPKSRREFVRLLSRGATKT
jgi:hypothetical protein